MHGYGRNTIANYRGPVLNIRKDVVVLVHDRAPNYDYSTP